MNVLSAKKLNFFLTLLSFIGTEFFTSVNANDDDGPKETITCESATMILKCPSDYLISIEQAEFGRQNKMTCGGGRKTSNINCSLNGAFDMVLKKCHGKEECRLRVGQPTFQDPCPGTSKYLRTVWKCVAIVSTCPGKVISVAPHSAYVTDLEENGGWYRDPFQRSEIIFYMGWFKYDTDSVYNYNTPQNLVTNSPANFVRLHPRVDGTGFVVYDGNIYYNKEASRTLIKYDIAKMSTKRRDLPNANYHDTSPYAIELNTDIDLAVDENGLWAIYATETNDGNIVVSKLNKDTLAVVETWNTSYEKWSALNAFVACGVLYVINYESLVIDYMYNMSSGVESTIQIPIPNLNATTSSVKYNPQDQMLYVWDSQIASLYKVTFQEVVPTTTVPPPIQSTTPTTTVGSTLTPSSNPSDYPNDQVSSTVPPFSTPPVIYGSCPGMESSGLLWPPTPFSETAHLSCPGDNDNYAVWVCGGNSVHPEWKTPKPDLSGCVSPWIKDLEEEITTGRLPVSTLSQKLAQKLYSNKNEITSWDIVTIVKLMRYLLEDATGTSSAPPLADSMLKISSELLQPALLPFWTNLGRKMQTETAIALSKVLEDVAFFLSKHMIVSESEKNTETLYQPYATFAIRIEPVLSTLNDQEKPAETEMKKVTFNSIDGDIVTVEDASLMRAIKAQPGEKMAVVHLTMKNLAPSIVDQRGFGAPPYPANSQIVTVSVKRMLETNSWAKTTEPLNLNYPIQLQLQHDEMTYSTHVCAFWSEDPNSEEEGHWWRSGCRRVGGNSSHSMCECDHLTNFVILSSNGDFPPMGSNEDPSHSEPDYYDIHIYINAVRGAAILSIIMLIGVLVVLFCWRFSTDLITIHKNLSLTVLLSQLVLVVGVTMIELPELCAVVAGFLHFSILSTFTWAAIETVHHLLVFHDVQERKYRWKYYYVIGYVIPLLVVGISAAIDHTGYVNQKACWLCISGHFMWAIVVPCGVAICISIVCITMLMYKLNKRKTTTVTRNCTKTLRWDAIKTCILMPLLCVMWSCVFVWLSGIPLMALLFAVSCVVYGAITLILRCFYHAEAQSSWSCPKFAAKKTESRFTHSTNSAAARLMSNTSYRPPLRGDGTAISLDYHYAGTRTATATSMVPSVGCGRPPYPNSARGAEEMALIAMQQRHDQVARVRDQESNSRNSFSSIDDGEFSRLHSGNARAGSMHSRMERIESRSSYPDGSSRNLPVAGVCSAGGRAPHQYERPSTSSDRYCTCTTATSSSCCYDRLHEERLKRGSSGSRGKLPCPKCMTQQNNISYLQREGGSAHQYETLGPFITEEEEGNLLNEVHPTCEHRYDEVEPEERCFHQIQDYHVTSHPQSRVPQLQRYPDIPESSCNPSSMWQNSSYGICHCSQPGRGKISYQRSGRNSDPLSTDQGYDTDSQQPGGCRVSHQSHSDFDDVRGTPGSTPGASSKMNSIVEGYPAEEDTQMLLHRNDSLSGASENDREVEFINSTSSNTPTTNSITSKPLDQISNPPYAFEDGSVIDTSLGGRNSVTDTVNSWSAFPGSNPRTSYPEYGLAKSDKKRTADPQIILAQAKQNCENRSAAIPGENNTVSNAYTLPGTTETGIKARIDLRTGGVNMVTNL